MRDATASNERRSEPIAPLRAATEHPLGVAMLASVFPPLVGGIQSHTLRLGQKLAQRGVEVHVVTRIQQGLPPFERMNGVRVHRVGIAVARGAAGSAAFIASALPTLRRLAPRLDLLHSHQLLSASTIGLVAKVLTGLPLIVNPHACGRIGDVGVLSASRLGRQRLRAIVTQADAFVAVSRTIRDELVGAGAPPEAIWHIANGVDTRRFFPASGEERRMIRRVLGLPNPEGEPLVLFGGRLAREKGVDVLLAAWPRIVAGVPRAQLCIVGGGDESRALREQARALGVQTSVSFLDGVEDLAAHARAADAAALPSRTEGMPVALLEAMSCALPVVATSVGGSAEVLDDGVTGRLVPAEDPEALAEAIVHTLRDPDGASRRGRAARAYVLAHHDLDRVADRFLARYMALTGRAARTLSPSTVSPATGLR
ncbi:MAG TPA: glycosyltransferase family 4 protein [Anaeromyxobacteraceae bacterium]|nr:glycosyltransferase family 4 protein [Anaeromyxobacteraceae bacterium]